ncbi:sensor histidine kinase [Paenibacillus nanensis]|uniref:sensor histidine kinase n=1 Tax=Paenibacillus nanensis TaxID=393251 RepID=UPI001F0BF905|nr:histidine kinase [Paenibacillus nanensis]
MLIKNVTMKRFIYFFIFFLLVTLSLFFIMNKLSSKTVENSLINTSKGQIEYTNRILEDIVAEASLYGTRFAADNDVRFFKSQLQELSNYDYQMKMNEIRTSLEDILISSHAIDSIGIYWRFDGTYITTSHDPLSVQPFKDISERGWRTVNNSLYYFALYPYFREPGKTAPIEYVVGVQLKTDYLKNVLENAISGESSNAFYLVNNSVLWSNRKVDGNIAEAVSRVAKADTPETIKSDFRSREGDYYILSKYIPAIDTHLITYTRMSDFLDPLNRNRHVFNISIFAILLLGLYVIYLFYRNFYRNVHLLQKKFHHVEQGNYGTRIMHKTKNEFSGLFNSFNHMVSEIQGLFASLKTETELRRSAELKQLQAQINPHFLYNSLFFVMSVAHSSPDSVIRMSKHLAAYYRYMTKLERQDVTLASEFQLAEHYLTIMSLSKQIRYEISLPHELSDCPVKPLMIQPIVENAIQHGIEERQGAHQVVVRAEKQDNGILITVADDGKGLAPQEIARLESRIQYEASPEGTRGVGLWNVYHRLINAYGDSSTLHFIQNDWGGLTVRMHIALQPEEGGQHATVDCG